MNHNDRNPRRGHERLRRRAAWLVAAAWLTLLPGVAGAAPAAGSWIENRASASYVDAASGLAARLESNQVQVQVLPVAALSLSTDQSARHAPGSTYALSHHLVNTGNAPASVRLFVDAPPGATLRLVRDDDGDGRAGVAEPELAPGDSLLLEAGSGVHLLLVGVVPGDVAPNERIVLSLRVEADTARAANTDTITVMRGPVLKLWKESLAPVAAAGGVIGFRITATNTGAETATGLPVVVDGDVRDLILLADVLPANTEAQAAPTAQAGGGLPLYHWRGEPAATFHTRPPAELAAVDQLAWGLEHLAPGHTVSFDLALRVRRNAAGAVSNQALARFGGADGPQPSISNRVVVALPSQPPVLSFFRDRAFSEPSRVASSGETVYVQADAAECNRDATTAEQVSLTLRSALTGDVETFLAEESAPNSGLFRIERGMVTADSSAAVPGDGWLAVRPNDRITGSLAGCGASITEADLLIDPYGVVYDSKTNAPVAGARVTLIDVTGAGNGGRPGAPARVFADDGVTPAPASVLSDEQGRYAFPKVPSSDYRFQVVPPTGYTFPSELPPSLQPGGRSVGLAASYGASFAVNASTGDVHADLPLDAALAQALRVRKRATREQVEVGDFLDYRVEVSNLSGATLGGVQLHDTLPPGFAYVPGSTRRDGQPAPDPDISSTRTAGRLTYWLGSLPSQASTALAYRVRVGTRAREGPATNRAEASSAAPLAAGSNVASAAVTVQGGVFSDRGYVLGRVFLVCPGLPAERAERGLAGVRLWLETGDSAITDAQGHFHFDDLLAVTHVVKLDPLTLPAGAAVRGGGSRDAGDAGSRFVDVRNGELRRADFAIHAPSACASTALPDAQSPRTVITSPSLIPETPGIPATPALPALETLLPELTPAPAFLLPTDGAVLPSRQTSVRVAGPTNARLELRVNDQPVPPSRIAKRVEDASRGTQALEYLGVDLPPGSNQLVLRVLDDFGNERARQAIRITAPGTLARIELAAVDALVADGRSPARIRVRLFDAAGVPVRARTAVTLEAGAGRWQTEDPDTATPGLQLFIEGGEALLSLLPPQAPGRLQLHAWSGTVQEQASIAVAPALRPLVAAGIVEGVLDLSRLGRGGLQAASAADGFEHELRQLGSGDALRGRAALFLQGKVKGETLLTLAYDSEKPQREGLFRDIQPERYYPVYGDTAERGFAAPSASPLYVRIDRGQSYVLYGDFNTAARTTNASNGPNGPQLARYQRSLTGIAQHHEADGVTVDAWVSHGSSRQVVQEMPGLGLSGPYTLSPSPIVHGSEKVELLVRDRSQPAVVLRSTLQTAFVDYELDSDTGRLLFRSPVPSVDADLNPVSVRISFETDQAGPGFWVMGGSADVALAPGLSVGASLALDQDPRSPYQLGGVRATWQALPTTRVSAEMASSRRSRIDGGEPGNGQARRVEVVHQDGPLSAEFTAGRADAGFDNPAAPLSRGREEIKADAAYALDADTRLSAEALQSADPATGARREGASLSVERQLGGGVRLQGGLRVARETAAPAQPGSRGAVDFTSVRARLSAPVPLWPAASVYGEAEQAVSGSGGLLAAGGEVRWASWGRLYARHEFINSFSGLYGLNDSQQHRSTVIGLDGDDGDGLRVFSEYRGRDAAQGRPAEAAIGLRRMWPVAEGLRISTGFERVTGLGGASRDEALALSSSVEWRVQPALRVAGRLEWRDAPNRRQWLATGNAAWKFDEAWSLLGKGSLNLSQPHDGSAELQRERTQIGLAWREPGGRWLTLARYGWQHDDGPDSARQAHTVSLHANLKASARDEWTWRYAAKRSREDGSGLRSRGTAQLLSTRWLHDLDERWDLGLGAHLLSDSAAAKPGAGLSAELGWRLAPNLWLAGGMSWLDLRDADLAGGEPLRRGAYVRLRFKFDESLLAGVLPP